MKSIIQNPKLRYKDIIYNFSSSDTWQQRGLMYYRIIGDLSTLFGRSDISLVSICGWGSTGVIPFAYVTETSVQISATGPITAGYVVLRGYF